MFTSSPEIHDFISYLSEGEKGDDSEDDTINEKFKKSNIKHGLMLADKVSDWFQQIDPDRKRAEKFKEKIKECCRTYSDILESSDHSTEINYENYEYTDSYFE